MSNRETRRAQRSKSRPVSKKQTGRGNLLAVLVFLIPLLFGAGLVWHAQASNQPAAAMAASGTQTATVQDASMTSTFSATSGDVPTVEQPTTAPDDQAAPTSKPKKETYLELDMSQGKGLFTAWRIEPSAKPAVITRGNRKWVGLIGDVKQGDSINMNQSLVALVTKAEKYVDPHPNEDNTPDANGNVAERVIGWSKHVTDTLLDLRTTDEDVITTPEHPFFVHGRGWVKAGSLHQGDQIETETADKLITVVSTTVEHKQRAVYNLDVENTHTFFVGKDKLLVHNGDCVPEIAEEIPDAITGYTRHGLNQAISRDGVGVAPSAILDAVKNRSNIVPQSNGTFRFVGQNAVVVLNRAGKVVSTWATNGGGIRMAP